MNISVDQWNAALRAVLTKAATDPSFREKCLSNAPAAIHDVSGLTIPGPVRFSEEPGENAVVLPPLGSDPDELKDEELLAVSGGVNDVTAFLSLALLTVC